MRVAAVRSAPRRVPRQSDPVDSRAPHTGHHMTAIITSSRLLRPLAQTADQTYGREDFSGLPAGSRLPPTDGRPDHQELFRVSCSNPRVWLTPPASSLGKNTCHGPGDRPAGRG